MSVIIIGSSLSGKTTILRQLKANTDYMISEMDEELTRLNDGHYPTDELLKGKLAKSVISWVITNPPFDIFFSNTNYFTKQDLLRARKKNYRIIILRLSRKEFLKRNEHRVEHEGYEDMQKWLGGMLGYLAEIEKAGLVDKVINAEIEINVVVEEIKHYMSPRGS